MSSGDALIVPSNLSPGEIFMGAARAPQPSTRTGYFGVHDFFRMIRRRWILIATLTVLGMAMTIIVLINITPIYSSSATVVVQPPDAETSVTGTTILSPNQETQIETKVEMLRSRRLARAAATTLHLDDDPEFARKPGEARGVGSWVREVILGNRPVEVDPGLRAEAAERSRSEGVVDRLLDKVDIMRVGRSSTIKVTASSEDPAKAALIANRLVETYIQGGLKNAKESRDKEIQALTARVVQVRTAMQQTDGAAASFRAAHGILASNPEVSGAAQVDQSAGILAQARAESAYASRLAQLSGGPATATSPLLIELRQQEATLSRRLGELSTMFGPGYPDVVKTKAELATIGPRIAAETTRLQGELSAVSAASAARRGAIDASISSIRSQALASGGQAVALRGLERKAEATNTLYMSLVAALNAKITAPVDVDPDISIISRASLPAVPSYPIPQRVLAVAMLAFLLLGLIVAFVVDTMDTTIRTAAQVRRLLGIPTLAMVPDLSDGREDEPVHAVVESKPRSRFAEAIRNLLIELESRHGPGSQVVVVTSPLDGEGKSTIATSLAAAAGAVSRRAVVVDFDLRRPNIEAGCKGNGVVGYLTGRAGLEDLPVIQEDSHFSVIAVGDTPMDPGALIASPRLPRMVNALRQHYDLVILNAPPILPVRDAKTLTEYADSTILVLRWGMTSPEAARVAMEMFERPITGAVINMVDYPAHARRGYGDAIHHIARLTKYYDADDPAEAGAMHKRLLRSWRRSKRRVVEALHFN